MNDEHNPYQVVTRVVEPAAPSRYTPVEYESAGYGRRFLNYLVDSVVAGTIQSVIVVVIAPSSFAYRPFKALLLSAVVVFVYYVLMEGAFGATVGKFMTNTRVVTEDGDPPGFGTALMRTLCRCIPFEVFSIFFSGEDRTAWHDRFANSRVIRKT